MHLYSNRTWWMHRKAAKYDKVIVFFFFVYLFFSFFCFFFVTKSFCRIRFFAIFSLMQWWDTCFAKSNNFAYYNEKTGKEKKKDLKSLVITVIENTAISKSNNTMLRKIKKHKRKNNKLITNDLMVLKIHFFSVLAVLIKIRKPSQER